MTVEQFYEGPCNLTTAFRKAHRIRREQANFDAYIQGAYVYEAILACRQYYNAFVKDPKPDPWRSEPLDLYGRRDRGQNMAEGNNANKGEKNGGKAFFESFMVRHNAKMVAKAANAPAESNQD